MKKISGVLLSAAIVLNLGTSLAMVPSSAKAEVPVSSGIKAESPKGDPKEDIAKMYLVKHELKFDLQGTTAMLDGKSLQVDKAIQKNGRVFVPLRTLQVSGAAQSVTWNAKKQEARVIMKQELVPAWRELIFRTGSDQAYTAEGPAISGEKIPAPFVSGGRVYIPVKPLSWLGISASASQGTVTWAWSDKVIETYISDWEVDQETTTFTMLYQQDMNTPQFLFSLGSGAWGGGTGKVTAKHISQDGRLYNRMEFTADLRPGVNPMQLFAVSAGTADFSVLRKVPNPQDVPVALTEEGKLHVTFNSPETGYVTAKKGEKIHFAGTIKKANGSFDKVTLAVQKYEPVTGGLGRQVYKGAGSKELVIKNNKFAGDIQLDEPGYYLITVNSPRYIPFLENGPASTVWAEVVVEVE
ncbi:copper amine oxidase-like protein [Fontibacillus phaseoli]|uniref:Copper amine oxidase-like protein n=1 Tax=Fontibacillus phaseoli TaxID=1416533 RepID=A0A369BB05_9BACL|nr:stalk domain-containing protein [Fontibacillus phaseoli]RCX17778.1 copper amine oxidase-like protein [Fontibacillus phaseoli]